MPEKASRLQSRADGAIAWGFAGGREGSREGAKDAKGGAVFLEGEIETRFLEVCRGTRRASMLSRWIRCYVKRAPRNLVSVRHRSAARAANRGQKPGVVFSAAGRRPEAEAVGVRERSPAGCVEGRFVTRKGRESGDDVLRRRDRNQVLRGLPRYLTVIHAEPMDTLLREASSKKPGFCAVPIRRSGGQSWPEARCRVLCDAARALC